MSDLVIAVRLKADGSGLVGVAREGKAAVADLGTATAVAGAQAREMAQGEQAAAAATRDLGAASGQAASAAKALSADLRQANTAVDSAAAAQRRLTKEANDNEKQLNRNAYGLRSAGQQFGDFGLQVASGIDPARAFGQQAGQLGYALSEMGGTAGKVGAFLTGPLGIAFTIAAAAAAPFIQKMFEGNKALEEFAEKQSKVAAGSSGLSDAQSVLGTVFDLVTGKIKTQNTAFAAQNQLLRLNIQLVALKLRAEGSAETASSDRTFRQVGSRSVTGNVASAFSPFTSGRVFQKLSEAQTQILGDLRDGTIDRIEALKRAAKLPDNGLKVSSADFQKAIIDSVSGVLKRQVADDIDKTLKDGSVVEELRNSPKDKKPKKPKKAPSTDARDEFGRDAADKIAGITAQFDETPNAVRQANAQIRTLDDLIDDLSRKKPPNFKDLIANAEAAKVTVRDGLIVEIGKAFEAPKTLGDKAAEALKQLDDVMADLERRKPPGFEKTIAQINETKVAIQDGLLRPYDDFLKGQDDQLRVGRLILQGRTDEAEALRTIIGFERQRITLSADQKKAIEDGTRELREQQRQIDVLRDKNQKYLTAIGSVKGVFQDITQSLVRFDASSLLKAPGKLLDAFQTLQGQKLFESLFGSTFRDLEDQINGTSGARKASEELATSVGNVTKSSDKLGLSFDDLAKKASIAASDGGDILVTASRVPNAKSELSSIDLFDNLGRDVGKRFDSSLDNRLGTHLSKSLGDGFFAKLGGSLGTALQTASLGSGIGGLIGGRNGASIGGSIGGAVGTISGLIGGKTGASIANFAAAAGPYAAAAQLVVEASGALFGAVAGKYKKNNIGSSGLFGLGGALLGGLFATTKEGGASITSVSGAPKVFGNDADTKANAASLARSVQTGVSQIAQALGGTLGDFAVSIAQRADYFRVDSTGASSVSAKHPGGPGLIYNGTDQATAISIAIRDVVADGGVKGLSAAVQKALASSTDLDVALKEAVKVRDLETLIGGAGAALDKAFADLADQAKERVELAKKYGFDLLKVEQINAEQRADLLDQTLKSRVGSLKDFLKSVQYGDLFEGDAATRRASILNEIDAAKQDAEAGVAGAADRLSALYRQLLETDKNAYGTAGPEYSGDRATAIAEVEKVIQIETDRINAASAQAKATTDAIDVNNGLTDETNGLLAVTNAKLDTLIAVFGANDMATDPSPDYGLVRRNVTAE